MPSSDLDDLWSELGGSKPVGGVVRIVYDPTEWANMEQAIESLRVENARLRQRIMQQEVELARLQGGWLARLFGRRRRREL